MLNYTVPTQVSGTFLLGSRHRCFWRVPFPILRVDLLSTAQIAKPQSGRTALLSRPGRVLENRPTAKSCTTCQLSVSRTPRRRRPGRNHQDRDRQAMEDRGHGLSERQVRKEAVTVRAED
jgi:hypothetical protein